MLVKKRLDALIQDDYYFNGSYYIKRGFDIFSQEAGKSIVAALIYLAISIGAASVPLASMLIAWPLSAGFYFFAYYKVKHGNVEYNQFFEGFNNFGNLLVGYLLVSIFVFLGFIFLIIPGIYLLVAYSLAQPIIVFTEIKPLEAMKYSMKIVNKHWFEFFGLGVFVLFLNFIGVLFIGLGLLITIPVTYYISYAIFEDLVLQHDVDDVPSAEDLGLDLDEYFRKLEDD